MEGIALGVLVRVVEVDDEGSVLFLVDGAGVSDVVAGIEGGIKCRVLIEFDGTGAGKSVGEVEVADGKDGIVLKWDEVGDGGGAREAGGVPSGVGGSVCQNAAIAADEEFAFGELGEGAGFGWGCGGVEGDPERGFEGD